MKKLMSMLLTVTLLFSSAVMTQAASTDAKLKKTYQNAYKQQDGTITQMAISDTALAPQEEFRFDFELIAYGQNFTELNRNKGELKERYKNQSNVSGWSRYLQFSDEIKAKTSVSKDLTIPEIAYQDLGYYIYEIRESVVDNKTQNTSKKVVGLSTVDTFYAVVQVVTEGSAMNIGSIIFVPFNITEMKNYQELQNALERNKKIEQIYNNYAAGSIVVKNTLEGNLTEVDREFDIEVTLTAPADGVIDSVMKVDGIGDDDYTFTWLDQSASSNVVKKENGTVVVTLHLKGGQSVTIENVPFGVSYKVEQKKASDYETTYSVNEAAFQEIAPSRTIGVDMKNNRSDELVEVKNTRDSVTMTGVIIDNMTYILILAFVAVAIVTLIIRRRMAAERE